MKKCLTTINILLFASLTILAARMNPMYATLDTNFTLPRDYISPDIARNWTGQYWNYRNQTIDYVNIKDTNYTIATPSGPGVYNANISIKYDAYGNASYYNSTKVLLRNQSASCFITPTSIYVFNVTWNGLDHNDVTELLRVYCKYRAQPEIEKAIRFINSGNSTAISNPAHYINNYTYPSTSNSTYSFAYPPDRSDSAFLTVYLPTRNLSVDSTMSIYVHNAIFSGNYTNEDNFSGQIYAKFNVHAYERDSYNWYPYFIAFYDQNVVYQVYDTYRWTSYYNYSLPVNSSMLRTLIYDYYRQVAKPSIVNAIRSNSHGQPTRIPATYFDATNLTAWNRVPQYVYANFSSVNYRMYVYAANFSGTIGSYGVNGTIRLTFNAYGNNIWSPSRSQIWENGVGASIQVAGRSWIQSIVFDRSVSIDPSDLNLFLSAWTRNVAIPYLLNPNNSTGPQFAAMNITGYHLTKWNGGRNIFSNYTYYSVYVSNFTNTLQKYGNNVYGWVNLVFSAIGNDTYGSWGQTSVYSNASYYIYGVQENDAVPYILIDKSLRVNYSDIQNFLWGYYYAIMKPAIISYYNITTNSTANRTIYLPNYYNDTQVYIGCSKQPKYCSGASSQSNIFFLRAKGYNLSITVNTGGNGYFNGRLELEYSANLVNSTVAHYGKETIIDYIQGNATVYLSGSVTGTNNGSSYHIIVQKDAYVSAAFDHNNFVQNAAKQVFVDRYYWDLQAHANRFFL